MARKWKSKVPQITVVEDGKLWTVYVGGKAIDTCDTKEKAEKKAAWYFRCYAA